MNKKYLILIAMTGFIVALDQVTKMYVHTHFQLHESHEVIQGFFRFTYVRNIAAAFGLFKSLDPSIREPFFLLMPPTAMLIIFFMIKQCLSHEIVKIFALSSIFAGAIGNYIDRLYLGFVVDFLDFHYQEVYSWPAFNVADIAIVTGVCLMLLLEVQQMIADKKKGLV